MVRIKSIHRPIESSIHPYIINARRRRRRTEVEHRGGRPNILFTYYVNMILAQRYIYILQEYTKKRRRGRPMRIAVRVVHISVVIIIIIVVLYSFGCLKIYYRRHSGAQRPSIRSVLMKNTEDALLNEQFSSFFPSSWPRLNYIVESS